MSIRYLSGINVDNNVLFVDDVNNRVGIGTGSPGYKLEVSGNVWATDYLIENSAGTGGTFRLDGYQDYLYFYGDAAAIAGYRFGSDVVGVKMQIGTNGNVGIGTTSPAGKLHIRGSAASITPSSVGNLLVLEDTENGISILSSTAGAGYLIFGDTADNDVGQIIYDHSANSMNFWANAAERMRITSAGALLVGTTSTTNTASGKIVNLTAGSSSPDLGLNGGAWSIASIGAEPALYLSSNIVAATGIPSATQTAKGGIGFEYVSAAAPTDIVLGIFGAPTVASSVRIFNNTERMRITDAGNVGIGTTSPVEKLDVRGGAYINGGTNDNAYDATLYVTANSSNDWGIFVSKPSHDYGIISQVANGSDFGFSVYDGTTHNFRVKGNGTTLIQGNVGIGTTSPAQALQVVGNAWINRPSNKVDNASCTEFGSRVEFNNAFVAGSTGYVVFNYPAASVFRIYADYDGNLGGLQPDIQLGLAYLTVKSSGGTIGNVGIGTTAPTEILNISRVSTNNYIKVEAGGQAANYSGLMLTEYGINWGWALRHNAATDLLHISYQDNTPTFSDTVTFNRNGNVGIGTTNPLNLLHVSQASANTIFRLGNNASYDQFIYFNGGNDWSLGMDYSNSNAFVLSNSSSIGTNDRVVVTTAGNFGIGTTAPASKLTVDGASTGAIPLVDLLASGTGLYQRGVRILNSAMAANSSLMGFAVGRSDDTRNQGQMVFNFIGAGSTSNYLEFGLYGVDNVLNIAGTGNVGIGTTSPDTKLTVSGEILSENSDGGYFVSTRVPSSSSRPTLNFYGTALDVNYVTGYAGGGASTAVTILSSGNVGIGTTSPGARLSIQNSGTTDSIISEYRTTNGSNAATFRTDDNVIFGIHAQNSGDIYIKDTSDNVLFYGKNGGNVGIGTTTDNGYKLNVNGSGYFNGTGYFENRVQTNNSFSDANNVRVLKPLGGSRNSTTPTETGAIKITYPVGYTNTMHRVKLNIYNYASNQAYTVYFGGYNYSPGPYWTNVFAYTIGPSPTDFNPTVRFGYDGTKMVVYVGELNTSWSYPQFFIEEVETGFNLASQFATDAWSIGLEASAFQNVTDSIPNTSSTNWARNGSSTYYGFGNVGIGTASPGYKLQVYNSSNGTTAAFGGTAYGVRIDNGGTFSSGRSTIYGVDNTFYGSYQPLCIGASTLAFSISGTDKVTIDTSGNVGIGTTAPGALLQVGQASPDTDALIRLSVAYTGSTPRGGIVWHDTSNVTGKIHTEYNGTTMTSMVFGSLYNSGYNSNPLMFIRGDGNVGIGTTSPGYKLDVSGTGRFTGDLTVGVTSGLNLILEKPTGAYLSFQNGATIRGSINGNNGTDGINLNYGASHTTALAIASTGAATFSSSVTATSLIKVGGTSAQYLMADGSVSTLTNPVTGTGTTNYVPKWTSGSAIGDSAIYDTSGNIVINGTTAINASSNRGNLTINGTSAILNFGISNTESGYIFHNGTNLDIAQVLAQPLRFLTTNAERMRITSAGEVLINATASNGYTLNVNGGLFAAGKTYLNAGYVNDANYFEKLVGTAYFTNGEANLAVNVILGNVSVWGYIEVEITSTFSYQSSGGKLTKRFAIGTNPNNNIYINESRVSDAMGTIDENISIGEFQWDSGSSTYIIPISHIVTTGNSYTIRVRGFSHGGGAQSVYDALGVSGLYTLTALSKNYPHYNDRLGIGTTSPPIKLYVGTVLTGTNGNGTYASDAIAVNSSESITIGPDRRADWGLDATTATSTTFQSKLNIWSDNEDHITFGGASTHLVSAWESFKIWINNDSADAGTLHLYHTSSKTEFVRLAGSGNSWINGGNVGIGTTAPGQKVDVVGASATDTYLRVLGGAGATKGGIIIGNNDSGKNYGSLFFDNSNNNVYLYQQYSSGDLILGTNTNEKMRITSAGNVGIGTTSPGANLHISGSSTQLLVQGNNYSGIHQAYAWVTNTYFGARYDGTNEVYGASGRGAFKIVALHDADNDPQYLAFYGANAGTAGSTITWNTVGFAQDEDGNVGIGTTGPTEKLHVDGSALITYNNSFQSTNSVGNKAILARVSPTSGIINYAEYATATNLNGFVIGSDDARVKGNITGDSLEFITNTSTRMTILSGGNVGINTTTPGSTLHVIGDVLIQTGALGVGVNPNATDGRIDASNDIVAFSTSDRRLKENITPIANALEKVRSLTGVEFDWKEETKSVHGYEGHDVGVIAQDVQAVLPEAVRTNDSGYLSVRYEKMIALLVEAMKEQQAQIDELKKLIK